MTDKPEGSPKEKQKNPIVTRIAELKQGLQMHMQRRDQARQAAESETLQVAAIEGAIVELERLLKPKPKK